MSFRVPHSVTDRLSTSEIFFKIASVAEVPLYSRPMRNIGDQNLPEGAECYDFTVKQFNVLAEGLSSSPTRQPPFPAGLHGEPAVRGDFGGFDSVVDAEKVFDFNGYRKWRLLEEILRADSRPDILTLQECDHFHDFFEPHLGSFGYSGTFRPKSHAPSCVFGYYSDGVAIFWNSTLFRQVDLSADSPQPAPRKSRSVKVAYAIVCLEHIPSGRKIFVATCHLKAKGGNEFEMYRVEQIDRVLMDVHALTNTNIVGTEPVEAPRIILMGDFNTTPSEHSTDSSQYSLAVDHVRQWQGGRLLSAYPFFSAETGEKIFSTWKWRGLSENKRLIDYIWVSKEHFAIVAIQHPPSSEEFDSSSSKLPDMRYPSDHLAITARLRLFR